ncbi:MAG: sugar transferase [Firmicutes bacterium]|uniref:Sugar transferase n=1 Tax=Sulfobacillus benefaciens TaxID=453960 RepID=A0A2T2X787_9FIRM|nr:sugar transferase [Bacillota bacterium]MCL5012645.1 sugar transferase [Bacillota bacterium]PSR30370.1 MAG: sugar transferase [Sulfobacillus benefaciens]HBQ94350.1 sugar transferase [Sulfobacillus sp.]
MFKHWTNRWDELAVLIDTGSAYLAYLIAVHVYLTWINPHVATMELVTFYFSFSPVLLALSWIVLKFNFKGYSRRWNQLPAEVRMLLLANMESTLALALLIFLVKATWFSRLIFVILPLISMVLQLTVHVLTKIGVNRIRLGKRDVKRLIIIGYPKRVRIFSRTVEQVPSAGMDVVDRMEIPLGSVEIGHQAINTLRQLLHTTVIDTVVLALPMADDVMMSAIQMAHQQGKEVRMVLDEVGALAYKSVLYDFYGNSVLVVNSSRGQQSARQAIKRAMDMVFALFILLVTLPVMALIALLIKWDSPEGSVFFVQDRVGLNGRIFPCFKFRTMVPNAESLKAEFAHLNVMSGPVFKIPDDPRTTRLGKLLRRTSLDELPQLVNVLLGHMSLVGPRPALPSEVEHYGEDYRKRLSVRPGITCLWQISGRNDIDFEHWMQLDMEYIDSWSLILDLKILLKTIPAVIQQKGAH